MLRNYLAAALRNLGRNRLYSAINVIGFAVALATALLIALYIRDEVTFEHFIPGYRDAYRISTIGHFSKGGDDWVSETTPPDVAGWLRLDFPSIRAVARLCAERLALSRGDIEANEKVFWADPDFFTVLPLPLVAGDLQTALARPDGIVLTRKAARHYFGQDAPIGATLMLNRTHPMRVTAVLEDLPSNTHLRFDIIASGLAAFSLIARLDSPQSPAQMKPWVAFTYFRLQPRASAADIEKALPRFLQSHMPDYAPSPANKPSISLPIMHVADIHLHSFGVGALHPPGSIQALYAIAVIGLLVVLIASANFVNLMTARGARRAVEVGVRKAAGASRADLVLQFMGESILHVFLAAVFSLMLVELALPRLNTLLNRTIVFAYWRDAALIGWLCAALLVLAIAAGSYPALVLSAFRPATVLRGGTVRITSGAALRRPLVIMQFSILIGLIIATAVILRQTQYAIDSSMRFQTDELLLLRAPCQSLVFRDQLQALPGVHGAACSFQLPYTPTTATEVTDSKGSQVPIYYNSVDAGYFELYGLRPVAGRFFVRDSKADLSPTDWSAPATESIVMNETAVRKLGFKSPAAAVGQSINWTHLLFDNHATPPHQAWIVGVVPDFPMGSIRAIIPATVFYLDPRQLSTINVKLDGQKIPETLRRIDSLWAKLGPPGPVDRYFLRAVLEVQYQDLRIQSLLLTYSSVVTLVIACLGIFGLSAFMAGQRTKEVGVRKAMGASRTDIVGLLTRQFTTPVLWANLVAWPVAGLLMARWLQGFAYHVELAAWMFVVAGLVALIIATLTTGSQALIAARVPPVRALREE